MPGVAQNLHHSCIPRVTADLSVLTVLVPGCVDLIRSRFKGIIDCIAIFERAAHAMLVIYAYIAWLLQDMIITLHAPSIGPENGVERSKSSADDGSLKQRINIFFVDQLYRSG